MPKTSRSKNSNSVKEKKFEKFNTNILKIQNVSFAYNRDKKALHNISLNIKQHRITALIGPSGCGKSTFLRLLNRMNDLIPRCTLEGKIYFQNNNIYSKKTNIVELRTNIGMIFQKPTPFPMSIYENIAYALRNKGIKKKSVLDKLIEDSLKEAALWDEVKDNLYQPALSLSGGQQQRVCIARAIAMKPKILLMDEPTSALDPIATSKIERLIYNLRKNYTIVIVTHQMQQAARISDYVAFFSKGKLVESGKTKILFSLPKEKLTENYITGRDYE